jgi:CHAT domain-containing protein
MGAFEWLSIRIFALPIAVIGIGSGQAFAARIGPDSLCVLRPDRTQASFPSAAALDTATARAEKGVGFEGAEAAGLTLTVEADSAERPRLASLARYCRVAGEAARISKNGSQWQAQNYLLASYRFAASADDNENAARAAYQLGLVSSTETAAPGLRGAKRGARRGVEEEVTEQAASGGDACSQLTALNLGQSRGRFISALALECAARQALSARQYEISALASLRLSRLVLIAITESPNAPELRKTVISYAGGALGAASEIESPTRRAEITGRLVEAMIDAGGADSPSILKAIGTMKTGMGADPALQAFAAALEARLFLASGNRGAALNNVQRAIFFESQRNLPVRMPDWLLLAADIQPEMRAANIAAAYRALESIRQLLPANDPLTEESMFVLHMQAVFEAAADNIFASAQSADDLASITGAQKIIEAYRQAEIQDIFGSECVSPRPPVEPSDLHPNEVILYPVLLKNRLEILYASGAEGVRRYHRLPPNTAISRRMIAALADRMLSVLDDSSTSQWREAAHELYSLIVKPVEDRLGPDVTLIVVPDGPLRAVPFSALIDDQGRYLVHRVSLSVAPSLAYTQPGTARPKRDLYVVAASLDREVTLPAGDFPALEFTDAEARAAAGVGVANIRLGKLITNFHKADLEAALAGRRVDVLHLATHAAFNGRSDRSFIVADGELIPLSDLRQTLARSRARGDDLDLLVLSACETAIGDDQAAMGLAGAAVQAGARSAVASLWQVNDAGTASMMKTLYQHLRTGESKASSLQKAQLAMIDQGGSAADPSIWAAFTLLGGWR